jgi:hypothetical protein
MVEDRLHDPAFFVPAFIRPACFGKRISAFGSTVVCHHIKPPRSRRAEARIRSAASSD